MTCADFCLQVDVWQEPSQVGKPVDFRVPPNAKEAWMDALADHGLEATVMIYDIET